MWLFGLVYIHKALEFSHPVCQVMQRLRDGEMGREGDRGREGETVNG